MNKERKTNIIVITTIAIIASLAAVSFVIAYTSWAGTITWTTPIKQFTVWDAPTGGNELIPPYTLDGGVLSLGLNTFNFYIQNDGNIGFGVQVTGATGSGYSSAIWSNGGVYFIAVGATRVQATLDITITGIGSYSWSFTLQ